MYYDAQCHGVVLVRHLSDLNDSPFHPDFIQRYVNHLLNESVSKQFSAFYHGVHRVCDSNALMVSAWGLSDFVHRDKYAHTNAINNSFNLAVSSRRN